MVLPRRLAFALLFCGAAIVAAVQAAQAQTGTYSAVSDFSVTNGNPNGVWSYKVSGSLFSWPSQAFSPCFSSLALPCWWNGLGIPVSAVIAQNTTGSTVSVATINVPTGTLLMDPESLNLSVVFTAPSAGTYSIVGHFLGIDTGENAHPVEILHNGSSVYSSTISAYGQDQSFNFSQSLSAGDTIAFYVGTGSAGCTYCNLSTGLAATITSLGTPAVQSSICSPTSPAPISGSTGAQGVLDPSNADSNLGLVWPLGAVAAFISMSSGEVFFSSSTTSFVQTGNIATLPGTSSPAFPDGKLNFTSIHLPAGKGVFFKSDSLGFPPPVIVLSCQDVILDSGSILGLGGVFYGPDFSHQLPGSFLGGHALNTAGTVAAGFGPRAGSSPAAGSLYPPIGGAGGNGGTLSGIGGSTVQGGMGGEAIVIAAAQRITVNGGIQAKGSDAEDAPTGSSGTQGGGGGSVRLAGLLVEGVGTVNTSAGVDSDGVRRNPDGPVEMQAFLQDLFTYPCNPPQCSTTAIRGNLPVAPVPGNLPTIDITQINVSALDFSHSDFPNTGSLTSPDVQDVPTPSTSRVNVSVSISTQNVPDTTPLTVRAVGTDGSSFPANATVTVSASSALADLTLNAGTTYQIVVTPSTPLVLPSRNPDFIAMAEKPVYAPLGNKLSQETSGRISAAGQWMKAFGVRPAVAGDVLENSTSGDAGKLLGAARY